MGCGYHWVITRIYPLGIFCSMSCYTLQKRSCHARKQGGGKDADRSPAGVSHDADLAHVGVAACREVVDPSIHIMDTFAEQGLAAP